MLPRAKRLTRDDFTDVAKGTRAASRHFSVSYRLTTTPKSAVVVSKKVAKKATDRHLLKRRVLEVLEKHSTPSLSVIVYAKTGSPSLSFAELKEEIEGLLRSLAKV